MDLDAKTTVNDESNVAYDATMSPIRAHVIALILLPVPWILFILPFEWMWPGRLSEMLTSFRPLSFWSIIPALFLGIVVHELLHALGFVHVGNAPWSAIRFGVSWKALAPYAHCRAPVPITAYRFSVALPGVVLGLVPVFVGLGVGIGWLVLWGALMTAAASGDLVALWVVRSVPNGASVQDHPDRVGCQVLKNKD